MQEKHPRDNSHRESPNPCRHGDLKEGRNAKTQQVNPEKVVLQPSNFYNLSGSPNRGRVGSMEGIEGGGGLEHANFDWWQAAFHSEVQTV